MMKIRNYFIVFASVFAISSMCALVGARDVKAQESESMSSLIKRIEALEASPRNGNVVAPKIRGLKLGFEIRHRFEFRDDNNGNENSLTSDFTLQRARIYLDADVNKNVRGYIKLQDVRTWGAEHSTVGNLSRVDLLEGFVELKNLGEYSSLLKNVEARVGRWQQWYGKNRWFGHLNWANQSRSYDGLRLRYDNKKNVWVDLWAYQINEDQTGGASGDNTFGSTATGVNTTVNTTNNGNLDLIPFFTTSGTGTGTGTGQTAGNRRQQDELFWGMYAGVKLVDGITVEPYIAIRQRSRDADASRGSDFPMPGEQRYHMGGRLVGKNIPWLPGVDFTFEQAFQRGRVEATNYRSNSIDAYGGAYDLGYTFKNMPWTPRVGYSYVFASGDDDLTDGDSETFSHLYPTGHATMGYIDFHAWQNIRDHQVHLTLKPSKKLLLKADYHMFSAADRLDAWYTVGGAARGGSMGGAFTTDDDYGDELDLTIKYKLLENFGVVAGYSHYFVDDFVEDYANRGGGTDNDSDADWFYIQTTMKF